MGRGRWNWPWLFTWPRSRKSSFRKTSEKPRQTVAGNVGVPEVSKITNYPPLQSPVQVPQVNFSEADMLPRMVLGWDLRSLSWELPLVLSCCFTSTGTDGLITLNPAFLSANHHRTDYPYSFSFLVTCTKLGQWYGEALGHVFGFLYNLINESFLISY